MSAFEDKGPTAEVPAVSTAEAAEPVVRKRFGAFKRAPMKAPTEPRLSHLPAKKLVERKARMAVAKILSDGEEKPLDVLIDNMRWEMRKARSLEALMAGVETSELMLEVRSRRRAAADYAKEAAPYIHSRLAPQLVKGEKGLQVSLIIEDV